MLCEDRYGGFQGSGQMVLRKERFLLGSNPTRLKLTKKEPEEGLLKEGRPERSRSKVLPAPT